MLAALWDQVKLFAISRGWAMSWQAPASSSHPCSLPLTWKSSHSQRIVAASLPSPIFHPGLRKRVCIKRVSFMERKSSKILTPAEMFFYPTIRSGTRNRAVAFAAAHLLGAVCLWDWFRNRRATTNHIVEGTPVDPCIQSRLPQYSNPCWGRAPIRRAA